MDYFTRALLIGVLVGTSCGLTGVLVLARRRVFFTQALTHATYPGAVGAVLLGVPVPLGAAAISLGLVFAMNTFDRMPRQGRQVASGIILTGGFALGAIMQALAPSLPVDPEALLVGSILTTTTETVTVAAVVLAAILVIYAGWGTRLLFSSIDPTGYQAAGMSPRVADGLSLTVIAATVVAALPAAGAILMIALIAAPAQAARLLTRNIIGNLVLAPLLGILSVVIGLLLSRNIGIAAGSGIALVAVGVFLTAYLWASIRKARTRPGRRIGATNQVVLS